MEFDAGGAKDRFFMDDGVVQLGHSKDKITWQFHIFFCWRDAITDEIFYSSLVEISV